MNNTTHAPTPAHTTRGQAASSRRRAVKAPRYISPAVREVLRQTFGA